MPGKISAQSLRRPAPCVAGLMSHLISTIRTLLRLPDMGRRVNELRAEVIESMQARIASMVSSAATSAQPAVKRNATDDHQISQGKRSRYRSKKDGGK